MTVELVKSIKEAESKAQAMISDARQEARRIKRAAEVKAGDITKEIIDDAEKKAKEIVAEAEREARSEAEPLISEGEEEISYLKKKSSERLPQAVELIKGKVVKTDADN